MSKLVNYSEIPELHQPDQTKRPQKNVFIVLMLITCVLMVVMVFLLWWVPYVGLANIHPYLPITLLVIFSCFIVFELGGALTLVLTLIRKKNLFFNQRIRGLVIRLLFPLLVVVGRSLGISKDEIRCSFVAINNELVLAETNKIKPEKLLILLPHCLQHHECNIRITGNVYNCKGCGRCKIKDLVVLSKKYKVPIAVATGGTLARKIVVQKRPRIIIAVACGRDLTSGIQDSYPIPVYGILNYRPFGPCYDTDVNMELLERGLNTFLNDEISDPARYSASSAQQIAS